MTHLWFASTGRKDKESVCWNIFDIFFFFLVLVSSSGYDPSHLLTVAHLKSLMTQRKVSFFRARIYALHLNVALCHQLQL